MPLLKFLTTLLLFMYLRYTADAQTAVLSGQVQNINNQPLPQAMLSLLRLPDSSVIATQTADIVGKFQFINLQNGRYVLKAGLLGYQSAYSAVMLMAGKPVALAPLRLAPLSQTLKAVTVQGTLPQIEQKFDRVVFNVNGNAKAGINAVDILKRMPGVGIAGANAIMFEGKGVTVYVDGKLTRLSGNELMALLSNMPSAGISQIEVIPNPSAKFDAQGEGGIINIKTLKRSKPGYDGYLSLTGGHGWKYFAYNNASAGLNYRQGNHYLYGSYGYGFGTQSQEIQTNTYLNNANQRLLDSLVYRSPYRDHNLRLGWDYYLNRNNVLGVLVTAYHSYREAIRHTQTGIYSLMGSDVDSSRLSSSFNPRDSKGVNLNLNYKLVLDSAHQQEITMDADAGVFDYSNSNQVSLLLQNNAGIPLTREQQLYQLGQTRTHIYSYKADYIQKLLKGNLEAGIKGSYVKVDNGFTSQSGLTGAPLADNGSNDFIYQETIGAAYLNTRQTFGKLTLQAGLRAEHTRTNGNSVTIDSVVNRRYLNLFPNIVASYKLVNHFFSLSYMRRIGRPVYSYLNPFLIVESAYSAFQGNPYLQPSATNSYRLAYTLKNKLTLSTSYSNTQQVITDLAVVDELSKVTTRLKANLSQNYSAGFYVSYTNRLFKLLDINYSGGVQHNRYQFIYAQAPIQIEQLTGTAYFDNQFTLPRNWWAGVYTYLSSRVTYGNQITLPLSTTALSGGKKIWNGKGTVSLNVNDIFFTGIQRAEARYGNVNYNNRSQYDSRNFRLNFTYNFGNAKIEVRRRSPGSTDEQRRTQ
jgi:iron complex outermembrane recepter protein